MKLNPAKSSLSRRFNFSIIGVVILIALVFLVIITIVGNRNIDREMETRITRIVTISESSLPPVIWNFDREAIKSICESLFKEKGVVFFRLGNPGEPGQPLFDKQEGRYYGKTFDFFKDSEQFKTKQSPIYYKGERVAGFQLVFSKELLKEELRKNILNLIFLIVVILGAIYWIVVLISKRNIFIPLKNLEYSAEKITEGELNTGIRVTGEDEIGSLSRAFIRMQFAVKNSIELEQKARQDLENLNKNLEQEVERRTAQLFQSEQKLKAILNHLTRCVYWKTNDGTVEGGNRSLMDVLRFSDVGKLTGIDESEIWKMPDSLAYMKDLTREVISQRTEKLDIEFQLQNNEAHLRWFKIDCSPLLDENQNVSSILVAFHDFTEEKNKNEELKLAKEEAERANRIKDEFLAKVNHEIRTPLNTINGFIKLVSNSTLTKEQKENIGYADSSTQDLSRIINDLLDFSRMESSEFTIVNSAFNLNEVLTYITNNSAPQAEQKNILFKIVKENKVPTRLIGDAGRLKQVLQNLVNNAIRYTDKGTVSVKVSLDGKDSQNAFIAFSIVDTGSGIPKDYIEKIFEPYQRFDISKDKGTERGFGLGLTISQQLVTKMGGKIRVTSEPGKGSTFSFTLPFELSDMTDNHAIGDSKIHSKMDWAKLKGLRILLVEDDPVSQILLLKILSPYGIFVDLAKTGTEAIRMVFENSYDIVLMDIGLPELSGTEAMKIIRSDSRFINLPIIAVTTDAIVGNEKIFRDAGASDFLAKPVDTNLLLQKIIKWKVKNQHYVINKERKNGDR